MKLNFTLLLFLACINLHSLRAQKLKLPVLNNDIVYSGAFKSNYFQNKQDFFEYFQRWILGYCRKEYAGIYNTKIEDNHISFIYKQELDPKGVFYNVSTRSNFSIHYNNGNISYTVTEPYFLKYGLRYMVYDVYRYFLMNIPYVKVQAEKKIAALRRHYVLMQLYNTKMNKLLVMFTDSFKDDAETAQLGEVEPNP
jgi:hypothetical protein